MVKVYKYTDTWQTTALEWKDLEKLGIKSEDIKWCKYTGGDHINRYKRENNFLPGFMACAEQIWRDEWVEQGCKDEGTCTGGTAIQVDVIPKRHKYPMKLNLAKAPGAQGNLSKAASRHGALKYINDKLKEVFGDQIQATYYDGWMD